MDKFVVRGAVHDMKPSLRKLKHRRQGLELSAREVEGRLCSSSKLWVLNLMLESYAEVGRVPQSEQSWQHTRRVHASSFEAGSLESAALRDLRISESMMNRPVITSLDFDAKGVYLASVSTGGCLTVHDFKSIYYAAGGLKRSDVSPLVHVATGGKLESVRWNFCNQNEVACVGSGSTKVYIFDVERISYNFKEVLILKPVGTPWKQQSGFLDLCYFKGGPSRVLACGNDGCIYLWDRRIGKMPCWSAAVPQIAGSVECLYVSVDDQVVYAGSKFGSIHSWDLRGGHSAAFMTSSEVYHPPLFAVKVADLLKEISSLQAQTEIMNSGVHSVAVNPSCEDQLAFHLNNSWTGVLSLSSLALTHVHCPPPPWQNVESAFIPRGRFHRRRPAWLPTASIYAVGSSTACAIYLLDLTAGRKSHCLLLSDSKSREETHGDRDLYKGLSRVGVSEPVVAIAAHPFADQLVAGTQDGSLVQIAPGKCSFNEEHFPAAKVVGH